MRRAFAIGAFLSTLLCWIALLGWMRSTLIEDYIGRSRDGYVYYLYSTGGSLHYTRDPLDAPGFVHCSEFGRATGWYGSDQIRHPFPVIQCGAGIAWNIVLPFWIILLFAAAVPYAWVVRFGVPRWMKYVCAIAIVLWPFELEFATLRSCDLLRFPAAWLLSLPLSVAFLLFVDFTRKPRPAPFPWEFNRRRRYFRSLRCQCVACGYDLRASPQRCPECGCPSQSSR
jgi:hypothetical protein